ncbi:MAG: PTS sugar transporter subunit IIA [Rectinemataceae bacterium]
MAGILHRLIACSDVWYIAPKDSVDDVLKALIEVLPLPDSLQRPALLQALLTREDQMSTAIGNGIAIPHVRRTMPLSLASSLVIPAYLFKPVDWKAPDGLPVHTCFLILAANEQEHLEILADIARYAANEDFSDFIRTMPTKDELLAWFERNDPMHGK